MIAVDVEATGTNSELHSIISIGALDMDAQENRFYTECQMFVGAHVMEEALVVNGFSRAAIEDAAKPTEATAVTDFLSWSKSCRDRTLLGQNVSFDRSFLCSAAERAGINWDLPYRTIDTHTLCYMHMVTHGVTVPFDRKRSRTALNLDTILTYCGIDEEPKPHKALTGALSHAEVAHRLLYGEAFLPEFKEYALPW